MSLPIPPSGQTPSVSGHDPAEETHAPTIIEEPSDAAVEQAALEALPERRPGKRTWPLPKQADPNAPLLVVEDLRTQFTLASGSVSAVDGVSFRLDHGEALGIAGESGCGKTTTALSLVRILPANGRIVDGHVRLMGIDLVG